MDAVRQLTQVDHQVGGVGPDGGQLLGHVVAATDRVARQPNLRQERHDVLLHPVVQIAFDPAAFGVRRRDDPGPRGAQLL